MQTQAYFEDIQYHIKKEINKAQNSVFIAVAWFTDHELFDLLCSKANSKLAIELILMDDEINNNSGIDFSKLVENGGKVWKISTGKGADSIMHNKFCIIDNDTVINGSYNWTNRAKQNYESITIIIEATELASQFKEEFRSIKERFFGADVEGFLLDYGKLCIRLDTLKNVILLEDQEDIQYQIKKMRGFLKPYPSDNGISTVHQILTLVEKQSYGEAVTLINGFINKYKAVIVYVDSEIAALKLEIKALELQISALEDEKTEIEKLAREFLISYNRELGELALKILVFRKAKLKEEAEKDKTKEDAYKEAEKDYEDFQQSYDNAMQEEIIDISDEQKKELKDLYRKASKLCHPDVVAKEYTKEAEEYFKDLKVAYDRNDIQKVNEILQNLEKGIFIPGGEKENEKEKLKALVTKLWEKREKIESKVNKLKQDKTYLTIIEIKDWDAYFIEIKEQLEIELGKYITNTAE